MINMLIVKKGNILDDDADWLVCPDFSHYKRACFNHTLSIGQVHFYHRSDYVHTNKGLVDDGASIINFPTKQHWSKPSKIEWIECGLNDLFNNIHHLHKNGVRPKSIAFPKLGCGLGGLSWELEVKPLIEKFATKVKNIEVRVYE